VAYGHLTTFALADRESQFLRPGKDVNFAENYTMLDAIVIPLVARHLS
jgi:hypothetical protein